MLERGSRRKGDLGVANRSSVDSLDSAKNAAGPDCPCESIAAGGASDACSRPSPDISEPCSLVLTIIEAAPVKWVLTASLLTARL